MPIDIRENVLVKLTNLSITWQAVSSGAKYCFREAGFNIPGFLELVGCILEVVNYVICGMEIAYRQP